MPLAAQQIGLVLLGLVDAAVLGRYDRDALGGAGVGNSLVFGISCLGMGIMMGLDALIPQAIGAGKRGETRYLLYDGLKVACWVGVPLSLLVAASPLLLPAVGVRPTVAHEAELFIWVRAAGVLAFVLQMTLRVFLQAHGITRPLIWAVVIGNLANALGDWALVFGVPALGIPSMGTVGAALSTILVQLVTVAVYAVATRAVVRELPAAPRPPSTVRRIMRIGVPVGFQLLAEVAAFAMVAVAAGTMGVLPVAGHQVAINLASVTFSISVGIGAAAAVRVGHAVGAGDHRLARRRGVIGFGMGAVVMSVGALAFVLFPAQLARLFSDDEAVVAAAVPMLRVAAVFQLSDGAQAIASGALRGIGDTRIPFLANVLGYYVVGLAVAVVCAYGLDQGAVGLWWGLSGGLTATAIGLVWRFARITSRPIARA